MFHELIYDGDAEPLVREKFPQLKIGDASDEIHVGRFEVNGDVKEDDFYIWAIQQGIALSCFIFRLTMAEDMPKVRRWMELAGALPKGA